jgi:sulfoxide reductase heme-binding subunit YedZ
MLKPAVFLLWLGPGLWLFYAVYLAYTSGNNPLGPDPAQFLALYTGEWSIRSLIVALAVTPARYLFSAPVVWKFRRMLGLFALFYASLHVLVFLMFLLQWRWGELASEISERPYVTVGFAAYLLMVPLGVTSLGKFQRMMGRSWKRLHRLVYVINILAVLHVSWVVRSSIADALLYGTLVVLLLGYRGLRLVSPAVRQFTFVRS